MNLGGGGSTLTGNTARANSGDGIGAGIGSTVTGNTASFNTGDGIQVSSDSFVLNNACDGAGIHATGSDNRIESNHVTDNDRGIDVDSAGNIVVKNTASGNTTNYDIVSENSVGLVVIVTGQFILERPWANIVF